MRIEFETPSGTNFVDAGKGAILVYDDDTKRLTVRGPEINMTYEHVASLRIID